jgi:hypothetical protein
MRSPWAVDVFENNLYWASKETRDLYVQDKFGRGRIHVLRSGLDNVHFVRVQNRVQRDFGTVKNPCEGAPCTHLCLPMPGDAYRCECPQGVQLGEGGQCSAAQDIPPLPIPKECHCTNGGICRLDATCDCGDMEGDFCQKGSTVSRQIIGKFCVSCFHRCTWGSRLGGVGNPKNFHTQIRQNYGIFGWVFKKIQILA